MLVAALSSQASAAKPTLERFEVDDLVVDEELSEFCGFEVTVQALGHVIVRTFEDDGSGVQSVTTLNIALTFSANGNEFTARDVGADQVRITPDGVAILSIIGQVPFGFSGVLKINLDTGEVILEPHHSTEGEIDEVCQVLGG
jgi:hypothetical protein